MPICLPYLERPTGYLSQLGNNRQIGRFKWQRWSRRPWQAFGLFEQESDLSNVGADCGFEASAHIERSCKDFAKQGGLEMLWSAVKTSVKRLKCQNADLRSVDAREIWDWRSVCARAGFSVPRRWAVCRVPCGGTKDSAAHLARLANLSSRLLVRVHNLSWKCFQDHVMACQSVDPWIQLNG